MIWTLILFALELAILIGGETYNALTENELTEENNKIAQNFEKELKQIKAMIANTRY